MTITIEDGMTTAQRASQARLETMAREIAVAMETALNPDGERRNGFALLLFEFGDRGPATYISNGDRGDMVRVVEEWLTRAKART